MSLRSVETRRAPCRHCWDARVNGPKTTAVHDTTTPPRTSTTVSKCLQTWKSVLFLHQRQAVISTPPPTSRWINEGQCCSQPISQRDNSDKSMPAPGERHPIIQAIWINVHQSMPARENANECKRGRIRTIAHTGERHPTCKPRDNRGPINGYTGECRPIKSQHERMRTKHGLQAHLRTPLNQKSSLVFKQPPTRFS